MVPRAIQSDRLLVLFSRRVVIGPFWRRALLAIALGAFGVRILARLIAGIGSIWTAGYSFYFDLARDLAAGRGLVTADHVPTAFRVPLYPIFVSLVTGGHTTAGTFLVAGAAIGTVTVVLASQLASDFFGPSAGLLAGGLVAIYPYYVIHDTALQETALLTCLTLAAVVCLIRARRRASPLLSAGAGLALAAAVLTRATLAPFGALAPLWLSAAAKGDVRRRLRCGVVCAAVLLLAMSPWLAYQWRVTGAPGLGTEAGEMLWRGQNPHTFDRYPERSMDESAGLAFEAMPTDDRIELSGLDEGQRERWFLRRGVRFLVENPGRAAISAGRKLMAAFGVLPSPRHVGWQNFLFALSYGPVLLLGLTGLWLRRRQAAETSLVLLLLLSFASVTALFFGHSSHRVFLDVYLIAYATVPLMYLARWKTRRTEPAGTKLG
jgi:4-amino-4-deoxy-L-arabinose transferase-like glycosyltransferase